MKVLNLRCANGHGFEGWFGSEEDFLDQNGRGLLECPLCADRVVTRLPSAPRLNLSGAREPASSHAHAHAHAHAHPHAPASAASAQAATGPAAARPDTRADTGVAPADLQAAWLGAVRELLSRTEDVGERFAEEARRIHYGEAEERAIRGQTSAEEREALRDEGIEVVSIPVPRALGGPVQ